MVQACPKPAMCQSPRPGHGHARLGSARRCLLLHSTAKRIDPSCKEVKTPGRPCVRLRCASSGLLMAVVNGGLFSAQSVTWRPLGFFNPAECMAPLRAGMKRRCLSAVVVNESGRHILHHCYRADGRPARQRTIRIRSPHVILRKAEMVLNQTSKSQPSGNVQHRGPVQPVLMRVLPRTRMP